METIVNIIIPVYKAQNTLPRTLDSLVAQTYKMFIPTIVIDGDDTDYTPIIEEYRKRGLQINCISLDTNVGPGVARNKGMESIPNAEFIMFLDADDTLMPCAVETLLKEIRRTNADMVISPIFRFLFSGNLGVIPIENALTWVNGKIYRYSSLKEHDIQFHHNLRLNEDVYFNLVCRRILNDVQAIQVPVAIHHDTHNSLTTQSIDEYAFIEQGTHLYLKAMRKAYEKIAAAGKKVPAETILHSIVEAYTTDQKFKAVFQDKINNTNWNGYSKVELEKFKFAAIPCIYKALSSNYLGQRISDQLKQSETINKKTFYFPDNFEKWQENILSKNLQSCKNLDIL